VLVRHNRHASIAAVKKCRRIGEMEFEIPLYQGGCLCGAAGTQPAPGLL